MTVPTASDSSASRRDFLKTTAAGVAALTVPATGLTGPLFAQEERHAEIISMPAGAVQLFVEMDRIDSHHNIQRKFHTAQKYSANPVIGAVKPWEDRRSTWGSVIYDDKERVFKAWYGGQSGQKKEFIPGQFADCSVLCYATSPDGIHWDRPNLGMHEVHGTKDNNVVIGDDHHNGLAHWESFALDPLETNPERRFKALGWSSFDWNGPLSGIYSMTSPDGVHWTHTPEPVFRYHPRPGTNDLGPVGDAQSLMIDTLRRRYIAFLRRIPHRAFSRSSDFVSWTPPAMSLEARSDEDGNTIYNHMGFVYGDRYLGQLTYLHKKDPTRTNVDIWLISSNDGEQWNRPETGRPLIEVGDIGEWDRFNVRLTGSPPIRVGDKLHFYYRNTANRHSPYVGNDNTQIGGGIGLATLRVDGFASVAAGYDGGQVTTKPFRFEGSSLFVNAVANSGRLTVEVLDEGRQPLPGFSRESCLVISADSVNHLVRWQNDVRLEQFKHRPIRLRFHLENARLYSYTIG